jgi:hypothetical protein
MEVRTVVREYIPGTQARRDRLFAQILAKEVGDCDGLAIVEWEDGSVTLKPVVWESELSTIMDPETGDMWFARGRGADPKDFNGIPMWRVYAGNAGVISTEACLIADQERWGDVVDVGAGEGVPDDLFELGIDDPNGGRRHDENEVDGSVSMEDGPDPLAPSANTGQGRIEADGGMVDVADDAAIYDLRPPEGFDGVAIDVRDPDDFDPYPVTREDAKAAAEWFERSVDDGTDTWMKGFIVGIVVTVVLALIFLGGPWIATQIAGAGGSDGGSNLPAFLPFLAAGTGLRAYGSAAVETVRGGVYEVVDQ